MANADKDRGSPVEEFIDAVGCTSIHPEFISRSSF
jgi:hypothetical protein